MKFDAHHLQHMARINTSVYIYVYNLLFEKDFFLSLVVVPASLFGELQRLEPLAESLRTRWRREMEWLLSVSDHIVELVPSWQTVPDGKPLEVKGSTKKHHLVTNLLCMWRIAPP
jgi:hypothetical protein